ncbi:MAG: hypothetical protein HC767_11920 [Akkermansiaceae bacterium]|nr:hypothetical protein [Akkermansiaceae bacterium]
MLPEAADFGLKDSRIPAKNFGLIISKDNKALTFSPISLNINADYINADYPIHWLNY